MEGRFIASDSALAMASERRQKVRRHGVAQALAEKKREGAWKVTRGMLWGKGLQQIIKPRLRLLEKSISNVRFNKGH